MERYLIGLFSTEIAMQCRFIVSAATDLEAEVAALSPTGGFDQTDIWRHLQTILVSSANLSKMFWGSRGRLEKQRRPLREAFQVDDTSPLRDPDLRNDFEHFDNRLESWFDESTHKVMLARNIGNVELTISGIDEKRFHFFNFATGTVTFWEHSVFIPDLVAEVLRIQKILGPAA